MNNRDQNRNVRQRARQKQNEAGRIRTYSLMFVCGLMLVSGIFFAGRQHFSSMDFGMKNSRLRKQVDELEAEKRRLLLAREISLSPGEIKKAVKRSGLGAPATNSEQVAQVASATKDKAAPSVAETARGSVIKTSAVMASPRSVGAVYAKSETAAKPSKRSTSDD